MPLYCIERFFPRSLNPSPFAVHSLQYPDLQSPVGTELLQILHVFSRIFFFALSFAAIFCPVPSLEHCLQNPRLQSQDFVCFLHPLHIFHLICGFAILMSIMTKPVLTNFVANFGDRLNFVETDCVLLNF